MSLLITGGLGYIGSHIAKILENKNSNYRQPIKFNLILKNFTKCKSFFK